MLVGRIATGNVDNRVFGAEARQGIHVGVGVVPCKVAVFQPEKSVRSKEPGELDLNIRS
jgi:predicted Abi (CAAX) family protease